MPLKAGTGRGRKKIPTALKKRKGTNRTGRELNEPDPGAMTIPAPLPGWTKKEVTRWRRICTMLHINGLLDPAGIDLLYAYMESWKIYDIATALLLSEGPIIEGPTGPRKNPASTVRNEAFAQIGFISSHFGFTPSSRSNISVSKKEETEKDEFDF